jgi:hypothetical protein
MSGNLGNRDASVTAVVSNSTALVFDSGNNTVTSADANVTTALQTMRVDDRIEFDTSVTANAIVTTVVGSVAGGIQVLSVPASTSLSDTSSVLFFDSTDNSINSSDTNTTDLSQFAVGQALAITGSSLTENNATRVIATASASKLTFTPASQQTVSGTVIYFDDADGSVNSTNTSAVNLSVFKPGETITASGSGINAVNTTYTVKTVTAQKVTLFGTVTDTGQDISSTVVSFSNADNSINSADTGILDFQAKGYGIGQTITISGSNSNDGTYTITQAGQAKLVLSGGTITNEVSGATVVIQNNDTIQLQSAGTIRSTGDDFSGTILSFASSDQSINSSDTGVIDFLDLGYTVGQDVTISGATQPANNGTFVVAAVSSGKIEFAGGSGIVNEAGGATVSGTTPDSLTLTNATQESVKFANVDNAVKVYAPSEGNLAVITASVCNRSAGTARVSLAIAVDENDIQGSEWLEFNTEVAANQVLERAGLIIAYPTAGTQRKLVFKSDTADVNIQVYGFVENV